MKLLLSGSLLLVTGCQAPPPDIARATVSYPQLLHTDRSLPIQVIREQEFITIINSTAYSFGDSNLWINHQYTQPLGPIPAGTQLKVNLWDSYNNLGEQFNAGGFWRIDEPTLLVSAELQLGDDQPLVGLLVTSEE